MIFSDVFADVIEDKAVEGLFGGEETHADRQRDEGFALLRKALLQIGGTQTFQVFLRCQHKIEMLRVEASAVKAWCSGNAMSCAWLYCCRTCSMR